VPTDVTRPDDDDYDLLTFGEAEARLNEELTARTRELEELEERFRYVGEDAALAAQIAAVQARIEALRATRGRLDQPSGERVAAAIAESSRRLELLEERMFYVDDDRLAEHIATIEARIEALRATAAPGSGDVAAEIEQSRRQLEVLEERVFYLGEDDALAARIAATQQRIEQLEQGRRSS
jgi:hypothetical protein